MLFNRIPVFSPKVPLFPPSWSGAEVRAFIKWSLGFGPRRKKNRERLNSLLNQLYKRRDFSFFNYGRSALAAILKSWGIKEGDEVLVPAFICDTVYDAVIKTGARPICVDVDQNDLNVSLGHIRSKLSSKTKAVIVASLYGNPAGLEEIENFLKGKNVKCLDDAAQSFGAKLKGAYVGGFGDAGLLGIGPGKSTVGPGGGVAISHEVLDTEISSSGYFQTVSSYKKFMAFRLYRSWFYFLIHIRALLASVLKRKQSSGYKFNDFQIRGMTSLDMEIARLQLGRVLSEEIKQRKERFDIFDEALKNQSKIRIVRAQRGQSAYVKFVFVLEEGYPERLFSFLQKNGIETYPSYKPVVQFRQSEQEPYYADKLVNRVFEFPLNVSLEKTNFMAEKIIEGLKIS